MLDLIFLVVKKLFRSHVMVHMTKSVCSIRSTSVSLCSVMCDHGCLLMVQPDTLAVTSPF